VDELTRYKSEIDLVAFAASRGYRIDRRESSRSCVVMRYQPTDDKILVSRAKLDLHWVYYSIRDARDHGSIVDFVLRRDGGNLGDVRRLLGAWVGRGPPRSAPELLRDAVVARRADRAAAARAYESARVVTNSAYLNARGLAPVILASTRFAGTFRQDGRGNVLFPHRDAGGFAGFESKNHGWTSFSPGGVRALWLSNLRADDTRLVLVESAIDALSFHQIHGESGARYASTAGTLGAHQREVIATVLGALPKGMTVVLAFDRDAAGDRLADEVRGIGSGSCVRACPPLGKDWNEYLQLASPKPIPRRGPSPSPARGR
jgi:hypothetical protein